MATVTLRKIQIIGRQCFSFWEMPNKTIRKVALSPGDYDALALPGTGEPPGRPDSKAVWIGASDHPLWDTTSGFPEAATIWQDGSGYAVQVLPRLTFGGKVFLDPSKVSISGTIPNITVTGTITGNISGITIVNGHLTYSGVVYH